MPRIFRTEDNDRYRLTIHMSPKSKLETFMIMDITTVFEQRPQSVEAAYQWFCEYWTRRTTYGDRRWSSGLHRVEKQQDENGIFRFQLFRDILTDLDEPFITYEMKPEILGYEPKYKRIHEVSLAGVMYKLEN